MIVKEYRFDFAKRGRREQGAYALAWGPSPTAAVGTVWASGWTLRHWNPTGREREEGLIIEEES